MTSRLERLQQRFDAIVESIAKVHGKDKAHCAAILAHMVGLDNLVRDGLDVIRADPTKAEQLHADVHECLMAISGDICRHLEVDQTEAIKLMHHFEQVLRDLLSEEG